MIAPGFVHAVETLGVPSGIIIDLQPVIIPNLEFVVGLSGLDRFRNYFFRFQMLVRQFEAMIPEGELAGPKLLALFPYCHPVLFADTAGHLFVYQRRGSNVGMRLRKVRNNRLVAISGVRKEIIDTLLFHQPRREIEIAFAVLHTVLTR